MFNNLKIGDVYYDKHYKEFCTLLRKDGFYLKGYSAKSFDFLIISHYRDIITVNNLLKWAYL
jgi:hypothetical protein